ncbi:hypothetical protein CR513_29399, partial [Mucuna pruriens]
MTILGMMAFLFKGKRMCVPMNSIWQLLVKEAREGVMGDFRELKTLEILKEHFYGPRMIKGFHKICERCLTCKVAKSSVSPHGLYTTFLIPISPWIDISMDFVLGLPMSKRGRDSIFVVVDRFLKMGHFIPCHNNDDGSHVTNLYFREVVQLHGLLRTIVLDRNNKFLRHFWRLGTKLLFSITCHPQTDGQTEVVNKTLGQLLRCFVKKNLRDWKDCIPHIEFVFNSTTSYSPFELAYGFNHFSPLDLLPLLIMPHCVNHEGISKAKFV